MLEKISEWLLGFVIDRKRRLRHRLLLVLSVLVVIVLVDNVFGFSYFYSSNRKLEQLKLIAEVKRDTSLSQNARDFASKEESDLIHRKNYFEMISEYFRFRSSPSAVERDSKANAPAKSGRNYVVHYLTSNLLILSVIFFLFSQMVINKNFRRRFREMYKTDTLDSSDTLAFLAAVYFITTAFSRELEKIPIIWGNPVYNYILNVIINIGMAILFFTIVWFTFKSYIRNQSAAALREAELEQMGHA